MSLVFHCVSFDDLCLPSAHLIQRRKRCNNTLKCPLSAGSARNRANVQKKSIIIPAYFPRNLQLLWICFLKKFTFLKLIKTMGGRCRHTQCERSGWKNNERAYEAQFNFVLAWDLQKLSQLYLKLQGTSCELAIGAVRSNGQWGQTGVDKLLSFGSCPTGLLE